MKELQYSDIIMLPHHVSSRHPRMSAHDRAAQFSPFAALTGFAEVINEAGRLTEKKRVLEATELEELDRRISFLASHLSECPEVSIEYFVSDERKNGGSYKTITEKVEKISAAERVLVMQHGIVISIDDISMINGELFESMDQELSFVSEVAFKDRV